MRSVGERLDVERLGVLSIDPIANATQPGEILQVLHVG
jgi:hypothetical protein